MVVVVVEIRLKAVTMFLKWFFRLLQSSWIQTVWLLSVDVSVCVCVFLYMYMSVGRLSPHISKWKVKNCHLVHLSISCHKSTSSLKSRTEKQTAKRRTRQTAQETRTVTDRIKHCNAVTVWLGRVCDAWNECNTIINLFMFELIRSKVKND